MSTSWIKGEACLAFGAFGEEIVVAGQLFYLGPRGQATIRLGRADVRQYFQMTEPEFLRALARGELPPPVSTEHFVTVIGHSRFSGCHYVKEYHLAKCPRVIVQKLVVAGLISNHDIARSISNTAL